MYKIKVNFIKHQRTILLILLFFILGTMTIGYASFSTLIQLTGNVTIAKIPGIIEVTDCDVSTSATDVTSSEPTYSEDDITFINTYPDGTEKTVTYTATITNNSDDDYIYNGFTYASNSNSPDEQDGLTITPATFTNTLTISGIIPGETIAAGDSKNIIITITYTGNNTTNREMETILELRLETNPSGSLTITLNTDYLDFRTDQSIKTISLGYSNTYASERYVEYRINNNNFELVNSDETALSTKVYANNTMSNTDTIYIKIKDDVTLNTDQTVSLSAWVNGNETVLGSITIDVIDYTLTLHAKEGTISSSSSYLGTGEIVTKGYTNGDTYGSLPVPTRDGYTFAGWYEDEIPEIVLPSTYTKLDYIYNNTYGPYIDLNYVPTTNTKAIVKLAKRNTYAGTNLWGTRNSSGSTNVFGIISFGSTQLITPQMNGNTGSWVRTPTVSTDDTSPHTYFISNGYNGIDQGINLNGTYSSTPEATDYNNPYPIYAAGYFNGQGSPEQANLLDQYYMIFWEGDTLDSYYVPCTRNSDNINGLCKTLPVTSSGSPEVEFFSNSASSGSHYAGSTTDDTAKLSTDSTGNTSHTLYAKWIKDE